ncbi:MAG: amidohydrolase family protein [Planctomycetota bacterium]
MLICALTCLAATTFQEPAPPVDGPFLLTEIQAFADDGSAAKTTALLIHANGSVEYLTPPVNPADYPHARVITSEEGWILYPGLVHANFPAGRGETPANPYVGTASDPKEGPIPAMEYGDHKNFLAWFSAADAADWDAENADVWRAAGFTSASLLPAKGLLQGKASHIAFNGLPLAEALYRRSGPSLMSLRGTGGYPNTQMAALAMLRQTLLDQNMPNLSPDLVVGDFVLVRANGSREIENILDLHRDFAAEGSRWVILGGHQAWKHASRLKAQNFRVLYTIDLPEAPKSEEDLKAENGEKRPYWQDPEDLRMEQRRLHHDRVNDYLALRALDVPCALVAPSKLKDLWTAVEQMQGEDGISITSAALYADLSTHVLEIMEWPTPAADLVISRGEYSFEEPSLAWVFSNGRGFAYPQDEDQLEEAEGETEGEEKSEDTSEHPDDGDLVAGVWDLVVETPMGDQEFSVELNPEEETVEVFQADTPKDRLSGTSVKFKGNQIKFDFHVPEPEMETTLFLKVEGGKIRGKMKTPWGDTPLTGKRGDGKTLAAKEDAEEPSKEGTVATGHPQWPIERRVDRFLHSKWAVEHSDVLFQGAMLYRMDGTPPHVGDILIQDGLITKVGKSIRTPMNCAVVDATGLHIMPGIIDAHSHLALYSINEGSVSITAECRIADMIQAENVGIYRAAAGGTALVQSLHGSANPIGGQAATWELDYLATSIEALLVPEAPRNIKFALGENVKQSNWSGAWGKRFPNSRVGVQATYRRAFRDAQDYAIQRQRAAKGEMPGFRRDVRLEVLADILDNVVHIQCHSYRADELLMFLGICREFGIQRPVFQHVLEGYKVAPELAEAGAMASTFSDWWAYKFEVRDAIPWNVSILDKAGVVVSINSDSDEMIRRLNTEAAKGMLYGNMGWEAAMATCTLNSAKQLRLEDHLGSLEVGKYGTLSIFDGPPLEGYSRCMWTLARGKVIYEAPENLDSRWSDYSEAIDAFVAAGEPSEPLNEIDEKAENWERWTAAGIDSSAQINGVTIHPMTGEPFFGSMLVVDGKIEKVVQGLHKFDLPQRHHMTDMPLNDATIHLYPAFINGLDRTGIWEYGAVRASRDDIETGTDQPDLSVAAAVHADSDHIAVTRQHGIAYVMVRPSSGRISGQTALIQLSGVTTADLVVETDLGLYLNFPQVGKFEQEDGPETPDAVAELDQLLADTLTYGERLDRLSAAGEPTYQRDAKLEAMLPYARGEKDIFLFANDAMTIMAARSWAKENQLSVVYCGARDAWKIAGYLGRDHARVIVTSTHHLPGSEFDPFDAPYRCASILEAAGCQVGLATDNPETTRNLPFQAATAAAWGLGRSKAAYAATLGSAKALGVDRYIGSIEEGKVASFFLCNGDPLLIQDGIRELWIAGKAVALTSHQTELRDRYLKRLK